MKVCIRIFTVYIGMRPADVIGSSTSKGVGLHQ